MNRRTFFAALVSLPFAVVGAAKAAELVPFVEQVKRMIARRHASGAISIPFACLPFNRYIKGDRYKVEFDRKYKS